ncbi:unnamed protein product [Nezara viridula]|uniref:Golgi to ER traffic protein 4 homolog n=1 Tax=Nezara viridula TaxID=85310 RepID=A0A9P0E5T0_NEZVI|nr:unnamed protein product [Nezara viridula]
MAEGMASRKVHGIQRVLVKIDNAIKNENFYEAHQMYKTLYFRYLTQKRYSELLDLLYDGANLLIQHKQDTSGADLANLYIEVLVKSDTKQSEEVMAKISSLLSILNPDLPERENFLYSAVRWSSTPEHKLGHPKLHQMIAQVFWKEKNYTLARRHFLRSCDGSGFGSMLVEVHQSSGYSSEVDLFIVQVVLQCLCLRNKAMAVITFECYTTEHPYIEGPPYLLPLLNFISFLLKAVESGALSAFTILCEEYALSLKRDPSYLDYLEKIGQIFFGLPTSRRQPRSLFGNLFQSILNGLGDSSSETETEVGGGDQPKSDCRQVTESELD